MVLLVKVVWLINPINEKSQFTILDELLHDFSGGDVYPCQAYDRILITTEQWVNYFNVTT